MSGQSYNLSYNIDVRASIGSLRTLAKEIQLELDKIKLPLASNKSFNSQLATISKELNELDRISQKTSLTMGDVQQADKHWDNLGAAIGRIKVAFKDLGVDGAGAEQAINRLISPDVINKFKQLEEAAKKSEQALNGISDTKASKDLQKQLEDAKAKKKAIEEQIKASKLLAKESKLLNMHDLFQQDSRTGSLDKEGLKRLIDLYKELNTARQKVSDIKKEKNDFSSEQEFNKQLEEALKKRDDLLQKFQEKQFNLFGQGQGKNTQDESFLKQLESYYSQIDKVKELQDKLNKHNTAISNAGKVASEIEQIDQSLRKLGEANSAKILDDLAKTVAQLTGQDINQLPRDFKQLQGIINNFKVTNLQDATKVIEQLKTLINGATIESDKLSNSMKNTGEQMEQANYAQRDMDMLKNRIQYFFSLSNAVQLARRAIRSTFNTVKELDAVMTQTAVVTDFSVNDMWEKLPEYASKASQLGASITGLYEATTLYYQQGLGDTAAMGLGVETMKMARVANMDAAAATEAMTAALRGFNMEINETSATRINDVYSELAAITAADTEQIATAMSKTASIASSANMEFETTAAFLAQIIETTQEAPETAGTAMKTIIARFTEVKKLFSEGMLTGEDEEGEAIEINKIDKALQSVGISLKDFLLGKKGIDDIFLELASKWDTLDLATQRYIATTAAGSRQQSRFIAMMSDYDRTVELVSAANNSAGSSQEQFNKTLDSLDAKLQKLTNAWDGFSQGIINSELFKQGIDLLTWLLETINKVTDAFGEFSGPMAKIGLIGGALKLGGFLLGNTGGGIPALLAGAGKMSGAMTQNAPQAAPSANYMNILPGRGFMGSNAGMHGGLFGPSYTRQIVSDSINKNKIKSLEVKAKNLQAEAREIEIKAKNQMQQAANARDKTKDQTVNGAFYNPELEKQAQQYKTATEIAKEKKLEAKHKQQQAEDLKAKSEMNGMLAYGNAQKAMAGVEVAAMLATFASAGLNMAASKKAEEGDTKKADQLNRASEEVGKMAGILGISTAVGRINPIAGLVTAGVLTAVGGIYQIFEANQKKARELTAEGQLEKATADSSVLSEDYKAAQESQKALASSLDSLSVSIKKIGELDRGTDEWKKAVEENNNQVLSLADNYTELSGLIQNRGGVLDFDKTQKIMSYDTKTGTARMMSLDEILSREQADSILGDVMVTSLDILAARLQQQSFAEKINDQGMVKRSATNDYTFSYGEKSIKGGYISDAGYEHYYGAGGFFEYLDKTLSVWKGAGVEGALTASQSQGGSNVENAADATAELAKLIAKGEINNTTAMQDWLTNKGLYTYEMSNGETLTWEEAEYYINHTNPEESFETLRRAGVQLLAMERKQNELERQQAENVKDLAESYGTDSDFVESLGSGIITAMMDSRTEEEMAKLEEQKGLTKTDKEEYAQIMGYTYDEGLDVIKNKEGQTVGVSDQNMMRTLAASRAATSAALDFVKLEEQFKTVTQKDLFKELGSEGGGALTTETLNTLIGEKGIFTPDDISPEIFNFDKEGNVTELTKFGEWYGKNVFGTSNLDEMMNILEEQSIDPKEFSDSIASSVESGFDRIADERNTLTNQLNRYLPTSQGGLAGESLVGWIERASGGNADEARGIFSEAIASFASTGDEALTQSGILALADILKKDGMKGIREISDFVNDINWNNPIQAASRLKEELEHGRGATKEFAQAVSSMGQGFLGAGSQVRYFLKSSDFDSMKEDLDSILETSTEITASDVLDLADQYKSLNEIIKTTGISAGSLAKVLEAVRQNEISIDSVSNAVIAAIANLDGLNSMVATLNKTISNFDPGMDEGFAVDFLSQAYQTLSENIEAGAWGNSQNDSYLDFLLGKDWDKELDGEDRAAKMKRATDNLKKSSETGNMYSLWEQLASGKDFWGEVVGNVTETGITIENKNGEIVVSGYEGKTTEQMVSDISKLYGVSENLARMMLTDIKNNSKNMGLNNSLAGADANEMMANMLPHLAQAANGSYIVDQSELETASQISGIDYDTLFKALMAQAEAQGTTVQTSRFRDENGNLRGGQEILGEMDRLGVLDSSGLYGKVKTKQWKEGYSQETYDLLAANGNHKDTLEAYKSQGLIETESARFDARAFKEAWESMELPIEDFPAALQEAVDTFNTNGEPITVPIEMPDGTWQDIEVKAGESIESATKRATAQFESDSLQNTIQAAIQGAFTSGIDFSNIDITPITSALDGIPATVIFNSPSTQPITDAISNLGTISVPVSLSPFWPYQHADGVRNAAFTHTALTGEEGPELIERADGTAYLTGTGGPEVTTIHPGDTVYTADETRRIFKTNRHNGLVMPRYYSGYGDSNKTGSGGKTAGDGKSWENPFDKLYNLLRKIDEELRERERIERRYEKLLEDIGVSADKIISISREELAQLEKERQYQEQLISGRKDQIAAYQEENSDLLQYAGVTQNERGEDILRIDWEAIDAIADKEKGSEVETYVNQLEEWFDSLTEAEDALWEIEDLMAEINERGKDEYFNLEEAVKDAVEKSYQDQIDELEKINDSINDTNAELLEGIQKTISKQRQDRENEKTEEDLADKQRRLSYLQMDTSGANAVEILKLQKEIEEGQENYTDALIDQKISELQEQNDEAAKQREKQIDLLQAQLDHYLESGRIWEQVNELMATGVDAVNGLIPGSELEQLLQKEAGFKGMSAIGKMEWMNETNNMIAQALAYLELGRQLENIGVEAGTEIEFVTADGQTLTGTVDENGVVTTADGTKYDNVYQTYDGTFRAGANIAPVEAEEIEENPNSGSTTGSTTESGTGTGTWGWEYYAYYDGRTFTGKTQAEATRAAGSAKSADLARAEDLSYWDLETGKWVSMSEVIKGKQITMGTRQPKYYKTGGLADYTGPAWLDGTKSHPELVLNARDTENFIQLKDILSSILSGNLGSSTSTENNGDTTFDIDINVESIGNDYDVDKVASRVRALIAEDARYRNNNAVSLKR